MAGKPKGTVIRRGVPFTQVPNDAITDERLSHPAYRVYSYLMKLAGPNGEAWPGQRNVAEQVNMARNTVDRAIRQLEELGWIEVSRSPQGNRYTIHGELPGSVDEPPVAQEMSQPGASSEPEAAQEMSHTNIHDKHPGQTLPARAPEPCPRCQELRCDWDCPNPLRQGQEEPPWEDHDPVWEFLTSPYRFDLPSTTKEQNRRVGRARREIAAQIDGDASTDWTPEQKQEIWDEMYRRVQAWPALFPGATLTPEAFAKHFRALGRAPMRRSQAQTETAEAREMLRLLEGGRA